MNTLLATNKISRFDNHWTHTYTLTFKQKYILVFYSLLSFFLKKKKASLYFFLFVFSFRFLFEFLQIFFKIKDNFKPNIITLKKKKLPTS